MWFIFGIIQAVLHLDAQVIRHFNTANGEVLAQHLLEGLFVVHLAVYSEPSVDRNFVGRTHRADLLHMWVERNMRVKSIGGTLMLAINIRQIWWYSFRPDRSEIATIIVVGLTLELTWVIKVNALLLRARITF